MFRAPARGQGWSCLCGGPAPPTCGTGPDRLSAPGGLSRTTRGGLGLGRHAAPWEQDGASQPAASRPETLQSAHLPGASGERLAGTTPVLCDRGAWPADAAGCHNGQVCVPRIPAAEVGVRLNRLRHGPSLPPSPCCGTDEGGAVGHEGGGAGRESAVCDRWAPGPGGFACTHAHPLPRAHSPARSHTCRPGCVATCIWHRVTADTQQDPVPVPQGAWPPRSATLLPLRERPGLPGAEGTRAEGAVGHLSGPIKHKPRCLTPPSQEPQGASSLTPGPVPGAPAPGRSWGAAETWLCDACRPASLPRPRPAAPRPPG